MPDSSIPAALGYAAASGIPYGQAIIKNRYSDRTFIKPDQRLRQLEVDLKFNLVKPKIDGARLVIVDDSIVRGNTMKRLVAALRHKERKRFTCVPARRHCAIPATSASTFRRKKNSSPPVARTRNCRLHRRG